METSEHYFLYTLQGALEARQRKNPSYSLRAFAKDLEMDSSNLSAILAKKRGLPSRRASGIAKKLKSLRKTKHPFPDSSLAARARRPFLMKDFLANLMLRSLRAHRWLSLNKYGLPFARLQAVRPVARITTFRSNVKAPAPVRKSLGPPTPLNIPRLANHASAMRMRHIGA